MELTSVKIFKKITNDLQYSLETLFWKSSQRWLKILSETNSLNSCNPSKFWIESLAHSQYSDIESSFLLGALGLNNGTLLISISLYRQCALSLPGSLWVQVARVHGSGAEAPTHSWKLKKKKKILHILRINGFFLLYLHFFQYFFYK